MAGGFTHEYWRETRDDWKARGPRWHWHCYATVTDGNAYSADSARRDRATDLPPLRVREWLHKPQRLLRHSPRTPDDAVAWLRREFERYAPQMTGTQATDIPEETRFGRALHDLQCASDISWGFWVSGDSAIVTMAVVGTAECRQH
jgi:hypothetical protein